MNETVCLSNHLTIFGAETISSPNTLDFDNINLSPKKNIGAIALLAGMTTLYIILACFCRYLDMNDLKFSSSIPLCGADGPFTYEITIKTGVGWNTGTTANVGIRLYGDAEKSGSRHLSHGNSPFKQGSIEIFQIAVPEQGFLNLKKWSNFEIDLVFLKETILKNSKLRQYII